MKPETDRIVIAGMGFGVWKGGRHLASTRWADVSRVRAFKHDAPTSDLVCIAVSLRDGNEILVYEEVAGFDAFLTAAEARLPGMQSRSDWFSLVHSASARNEKLLFDRAIR